MNFEILDNVEVPAIKHEGREARSPYIPFIQQLAEKALAKPGSTPGVVISAKDDGWVVDKVTGEKLRHKFYNAAVAWGAKQPDGGIKFKFRTLNSAGDAQISVNPESPAIVAKMPKAEEKQTA